jgi:assimilatory nitrate reductase catalytic subunit
MVRGWSSPEAAFRILQELSRDQPCDFSGIDGYRALHEQGGIQWPCPPGDSRPETHRRLFTDGVYYSPEGKARFCYAAPCPAPELPDDEYPFALLSGRASVGQWHTETRTGKSEVLRKLASPDPYVEIHPDDASRLDIVAHQRVRVSSRRGTVEVVARPTRSIRPGQVFMPMHYPETNRLTFPAFDPHSRQPSYKMAAVRLEPLAARRGTEHTKV